jgi:hypothetical protein
LSDDVLKAIGRTGNQMIALKLEVLKQVGGEGAIDAPYPSVQEASDRQEKVLGKRKL